NIYYLRGYARTKCYSADASRMSFLALFNARADFQRCQQANRQHPKAGAAIEKIDKLVRQPPGELFADVIGPVIGFLACAGLFLFAQLDFFFPSWLPSRSPHSESSVYISLSFGALIFMVAGLYLPKVQKLKGPGIELDKTTVDRVSAPVSLDISRSG